VTQDVPRGNRVAARVVRRVIRHVAPKRPIQIELSFVDKPQRRKGERRFAERCGRPKCVGANRLFGVCVRNANVVRPAHRTVAIGGGTVQFTGDLTMIQDVNNWLGRSNYSVDPALFASLIEFRIYEQALTAAQIGLSFRAGPGALG